MRVLITGGAGFVGSHLSRRFRETGASVVALDNLRRRGAEINLTGFKTHGIEFVHGDIRQAADLEDLSGNFDLFIEASAEPSVLAGLTGSPQYLLQSNLVGTLNCLEFARKRAPNMIFLSTSRVYSITPLREIALDETATRFEIGAKQTQGGVGPRGIAENFATHLPRSLYGATKLGSELVIQEYVDTYRINALINRCGVIAGPGQFGKVDQGVFTLWVANHHFGKALKYTGFGGEGKQVRDLLHPEDLFKLLQTQAQCLSQVAGGVYNVGGGREVSVSMAELTEMCKDVTGRSVKVGRDLTTNKVDIPLYISDAVRVHEKFGWKPLNSAEQIVKDIHQWLQANEALLKPLFN